MSTMIGYIPAVLLVIGVANFVRSILAYGYGRDKGETPREDGPSGPEQSRVFKLTALYFTVLAIATKIIF